MRLHPYMYIQGNINRALMNIPTSFPFDGESRHREVYPGTFDQALHRNIFTYALRNLKKSKAEFSLYTITVHV